MDADDGLTLRAEQEREAYRVNAEEQQSINTRLQQQLQALKQCADSAEATKAHQQEALQ